jgi:hypothetical protein
VRVLYKYYIKVAIDLIVQPDVLVCMLNCTWFDTIATDAVTGAVLPKSTVEKSVNCTEVPFHTAITSPALEAKLALAHVYLKNAEVYEPVFCVNKLFEPTDDAAIEA